jgi:hypothetical protein
MRTPAKAGLISRIHAQVPTVFTMAVIGISGWLMFEIWATS